MKTRTLLATAVAGTLAFGLSGAEAATPTLDGARTKTVTLKATGAPQTNDADYASLEDSNRLNCKMPRCARVDFVWKPAKGVSGNVAFKATWAVPVADIDLYVGAVGKDGSVSELGSCGATAGTQEQVYLPSSAFKAGKKYAMIVDFYRTAATEVTATATMPGTNAIKKSVPAEIDSLQSTNCGL